MVVRKPPICKLGLFMHESIQRDELLQSCQQQQKQNTPNRVLPPKPYLLPDHTKPTYFTPGGEDTRHG